MNRSYVNKIYHETEQTNRPWQFIPITENNMRKSVQKLLLSLTTVTSKVMVILIGIKQYCFMVFVIIPSLKEIGL